MPVTYKRSPMLPGVESFCTVNDTKLWKVYHEKYEIVLTYDGCGGARYRRSDWELPPGTLAVMEPGTVHTVFRNVDTSSRVLIVEPHLLTSFLPDTPSPERVHFDPGVYGTPKAIHTLHRHAHRLFDAPADPLELEEAVCRVVCSTHSLLGERRGQRLTWPRHDPDRTRRARERLDMSLTEASPTLEELARELGCDRLHVLRSFKHHMGITPHQYIIQRRIWVARRLLAAGQSVAATAALAGFCDQSHLTRFFTRIVGVSPACYRAG